MIYQIHTCTISGYYEEGEDWLVEAESVEDAEQKAKDFIWGSYYEDPEDPQWEEDKLDLDGGERIIQIQSIEPVTFSEWVKREIEKQSMGKPVKFKE